MGEPASWPNDRRHASQSSCDRVRTGGVDRAPLASNDFRPDLIVVDTLARCMRGGDENNARDMGQAVEGLEFLKRTLGAAVLVIHHTTKGRDTERGSRAVRGTRGCDAVLQDQR